MSSFLHHRDEARREAGLPRQRSFLHCTGEAQTRVPGLSRPNQLSVLPQSHKTGQARAPMTQSRVVQKAGRRDKPLSAKNRDTTQRKSKKALPENLWVVSARCCYVRSRGRVPLLCLRSISQFSRSWEVRVPLLSPQIKSKYTCRRAYFNGETSFSSAALCR